MMSSTAKTVLMVAVAIVIFIVGILIGMSTNTGGTTAIVAPGGKTVNPLSSGVISSVFAFGKLTSVSGQNINVANGSAAITVATTKDTKITSYDQTKDATGKISVTPKNITLADLKIGDYLNINLKVLPSGQLTATSINRVVVNAGK